MRHFKGWGKLTALVVLGLIVLGCKAKKAVGSGAVDTALSTKRIIQGHYANALEFSTLSGKVKIDYYDGDKKQGITVSLRMKKDEAIWVSAPLGIFKAYLTPSRVSFYNKLEGEYFDGDFEYLSDLLGTPMDFRKVENLLLGNTVLDLRDDKYKSSVMSDGYALQPKLQKELYEVFFALEPRYFRTKTQQVSQPQENRILTMEYAYQDLGGEIAPSLVSIEAADNEEIRSILLDFKNMELNRTLNFPYKIPKGYKSVVAR